MGPCCPLRGALVAPPAYAICRVVESEDAPPVAFDATTSAFFVLSEDVVIDFVCPEDADAIRYASDRAARDLTRGGALVRDVPVRGLPPHVAIGAPAPSPSSIDAGTPDAGTPRICRDGSAATPITSPVVSLVIQPRILGGGGHAGLVMPVDARPDVARGPSDAFASLGAVATALRTEVHETVIVTEDPSLGFQCTDPHYTSEREVDGVDEALAAAVASPLALYGCGASDGSPYYRPGTSRRDTREIDYGDAGTVRYESIPVSDAYDVTVLSASTLDALVAWMDEHHFAHDAVDDAAFGAYVGDGRWFVALDVHPPDELDATELSVTGLAPLVVSWPHRGRRAGAAFEHDRAHHAGARPARLLRGRSRRLLLGPRPHLHVRAHVHPRGRAAPDPRTVVPHARARRGAALLREPFVRQPIGRGYYCAAASFPVSGFGPVLFALAWLLYRGRRPRA
ncbi:MAG: hypothetical protein OHK0013_10120 [Sandaracinaceae bacterium]